MDNKGKKILYCSLWCHNSHLFTKYWLYPTDDRLVEAGISLCALLGPSIFWAPVDWKQHRTGDSWKEQKWARLPFFPFRSAKCSYDTHSSWKTELSVPENFQNSLSNQEYVVWYCYSGIAQHHFRIDFIITCIHFSMAWAETHPNCKINESSAAA